MREKKWDRKLSILSEGGLNRNCGLGCFVMVEIARIRDREIELLFILELLKIKVKDATGPPNTNGNHDQRVIHAILLNDSKCDI